MSEELISTDPIERSNSPAIINIATGIARIPSSAQTSSQAAVPPELRKPLFVATMAKKT
jgi:hypothetical protein